MRILKASSRRVGWFSGPVALLVVLWFLQTLLPIAHAKAAPDQTAWRVQAEPQVPVNGAAVLFRITAPADLKELNATWFDHKLSFRHSQDCNCWFGVGG